MPLRDWSEFSLAEAADPRNGAGIKQAYFVPVGVQLARVSDFTDRSIDLSSCIYVDAEHAALWRGHILEEGDVLVATVGSWPPNWSSVVGKAVRVPVEAAGSIQNQNTCCVRAKKGIADQRFLFYLLRTADFIHHAAYSAAGSANQARLAVRNLFRFQFACPPVDEQRAIAEVLGSLDDKIELNRRMNRTLEQMAAAIFKAWFVDFEPVKAKAAGAARFPTMPQPVFDALPTEFTDSPLGPIPKGWEASNIKQQCALVMGQSPKSEFYNEDAEGLPFHQGVRAFGERFPTHNVYCTVPNRLAEKGDVLFSVRAPVGRINLADRQLIVGRGVAAIRHNECGQSFLLYALKQKFREEDSMGSGTVFAAVTKKDMEGIELLVPRPEILTAFEQHVGLLDERYALNVQESVTLANIRDALLPKLLSGEIRVGAAERIVEDVA